MSFWLDETSRSPSYWSSRLADPPAEAAEPEPVQLEPALLHAPVLKAPAARIPWRSALIATGMALLIHLVLLVMFAWSGSTPLPKAEPASTGTMFASLVPASSLSMQPSAEPPRPASAVETVSDDQSSPLQTSAVSPSATPPPEATTAPPVQSADIEEANLNTSRISHALVGAVHKDSDNPWAHASISTAALSPEEKLWAAIRPCLQVATVGPVVFDLGLDALGRVKSVSNPSDEGGRDDPVFDSVVRAVRACGPYDRLIQGAGSYRITASS